MTKRALLIGINEYQYVPSLHGCVNDIEAVAAVLTERHAFDPANMAQLITAADTTRAGILAGLQRLVEETDEGDVCVVYYSGHGSQAPDPADDADEEDDGLDETIVPSDSGRDDHEVRDIVDDELHSYIAALAERTPYTTFVFDSCHSGSVDRELLMLAEVEPLEAQPVPRAIPAATKAPAERSLFPSAAAASAGSPSPSATGLMPRGDYLMIGGCLDPQTSKETAIDGKTHGVLTYYLTKELRDAPADASLESVFTRAAEQVKATVKEQDPVLEGPDGSTTVPPFSDSAVAPR
jgi:hypothetical protein